MIEFLSGTLKHVFPTGIILDVNGVGYGLGLPASILCRLPPPGSSLELWVHTYVREDSLRLFGFSTQEEKLAFEILLSISGVGPKVAMAIMSTLSIGALCHAAQKEDPSILETVPGIGKRTSEKILVELKGKINKLIQKSPPGTISVNFGKKPVVEFDEFAPPGMATDNNQGILGDVFSALENLGYKEKDIFPVFRVLEKKVELVSLDFNALLKAALLELGNRSGRLSESLSNL